MDEIDFKKTVEEAMAAFKARLLCYNIENNMEPPLVEVRAAAMSALDKLIVLVLPPWMTGTARDHFDVTAETMLEEGLVSIQILPKTIYGEHLLGLLGELGINFT